MLPDPFHLVRLIYPFATLPRRPVGFLVLGMTAIALSTSGCAKLKQAVFPNAEADSIAAIPASPAKYALAQHLTKTGAKLYGTYWCPYCKRQKEMFGAALKDLQDVECDPKGRNAQPQVCDVARVSSYPSWEINGKLYRGMRSLEELALLSNFPGSTGF